MYGGSPEKAEKRSEGTARSGSEVAGVRSGAASEAVAGASSESLQTDRLSPPPESSSSVM